MRGLNRIILTFGFFFCFHGYSSAQEGISVGTDIALLRNMGGNQQFFTVGQTLVFNYHFTPKHSFYGWFMYYLPGKFSNEFSSTAKSTATIPQQVNYKVNASWAYREISLGWKYYVKGSPVSTNGYNIYSLAGLGLMFSKASNLTTLDTTLYQPAARPELGEKNFARLNLDLGVGGEFPLASNIYLYGDLRTWINTSSYPVTVFHTDKHATQAVSIHFGMRILFD
jgi:hypothetical protein